MTHICLHPSAGAFLERAGQWLERAEMENAMALHSARFARNDDSGFEKPLYWATLEQGGEIVGCAFRTPPFRLGMTALPLETIPALVDSVAAVYPTLTGVAGPEPAASEFTARWMTLRGGGSWSVQSRQQLLTHEALVPTDQPPPGTLRLATFDDGVVARQWGNAFEAETGIVGLNGRLCARLILDRRLYLWDDRGPCCMLGVLRETRDAAAIGVLYTPPQLRDRGYATAAVSTFSRQLLERGLPRSYFCLDPGCPAADSICQRLGYGVVQETVDIDFAVS